VAWKTQAECFEGRMSSVSFAEKVLLNPHSAVQLVAIANDITYNSGAFGPKEDAAFRAATEYALDRKLPVVYLAANSGARVGLANEIKACLKVRLFDP
jgi:acetyl-CoA carboxylase carboxyltransferase component